MAARLNKAVKQSVPLLSVSKQWGSQLVALNGMTQSFALPLTISYAMAAVMTMRSGDFSGFVACPYWTECTTDTIMITPDYETQQGYTGTGKSNVTWILLGNHAIKKWQRHNFFTDFGRNTFLCFAALWHKPSILWL